MQIRGLLELIPEYQAQLRKKRVDNVQRLRFARVCGLENTMHYAFLRLGVAVEDVWISLWVGGDNLPETGEVDVQYVSPDIEAHADRDSALP